MASDYDTTEFVDTEVPTNVSATPASVPEGGSSDNPAPSQEELDSQASDVQSKLAKLKRKREQLEEERNKVEDARQRRSELTQGHEEMLHHLTRGVVILEEEAIAAQREAEQSAKTLSALQTALEGIKSVDQTKWNSSDWMLELTKAQTAVENARHEWNAARLKYERLDSVTSEPVRQPDGTMPAPRLALTEQSFGQLCRLGFALTWPIATAIIAVLLVMLLR
jgi:hypothetical protein